MINITATELKSNLGKYLDLASKEDIYISKNGKKIAKLTNTIANKLEALDNLVATLPPDIDADKIRDERLEKI